MLQPGAIYGTSISQFLDRENTWVFKKLSLINFVGGELVGQLLTWVQNKVNDCEQMVEEVLRAQPIDSHESFWSTVSHRPANLRWSDGMIY